MIRPPPSSPLFPTPPLSPPPAATTALPAAEPALASFLLRSAQGRSEEHTSELQSPCNLVCRLLLEKKKNQLRDRRRDHHHLHSTLSLDLRKTHAAPPRATT